MPRAGSAGSDVRMGSRTSSEDEENDDDTDEIDGSADQIGGLDFFLVGRAAAEP
jgi:hypothetical protein